MLNDENRQKEYFKWESQWLTPQKRVSDYKWEKKRWIFCPSKMYVCGFQISIEYYTENNDNSAVNAVNIFCCVFYV